jgi:hypothetical protein
MQWISDDFYLASQRSGFHQYLEVNGFLVSLIKTCQAMLEEGIDFQMNQLCLEVEQAHYIGEKLNCIFGGALLDEDNFKAFFRALFEVPTGARVDVEETGEEVVIRLGRRRPKGQVDVPEPPEEQG